MKRIFHRTSRYVTPMLIVDGDPDPIIKYVWKTSSTIREEDRANPDFVVTECDYCHLDPGGRMSLKDPFEDFTIDGSAFTIKPSHVEGVLKLMALAQERVPGYIRFPNWNGWTNTLVYMSAGLFQALQTKLKDLMMTSKSLHANLEFNEGLNELKKFNENI